MECFPAPRNALPEWRATVANTILPWDCAAGFESFPSRQGLADTLWWEDMPDDRLITILQSWLFFGLLSDVLQSPIVIDDYAIPCKYDGLRFLSLRPLTDQNVVARIGRSDRATTSSQVAAQTLARLEAHGRLSNSPAAETGLAIYMLLDRIRLAQDKKPEEGKITSWHQTWTNSFLKTNMTDAGWCPQQADFLFQRNSPFMMAYLARLPRNNPSNITHASCTELRCVGNNVELGGGYKCRHVIEDCQCEAVFANTDKVTAIIRRGGVPLVSICTETDGSLHLKVSKATYLSRYTAISHVWADGLGNPNGNGLPACQLRRLSMQLSHIVEGRYGGTARHSYSPENPSWIMERSPLFWMDTLCIPVGEPDDEEVNRLKTVAINSMARIYAGARQVLVLDAELQTHTVVTGDLASQDEVMAWIVTATWMRRCWTLHEGALGRRVWFQFADAAMHCQPHELSEALCSGEHPAMRLSNPTFRAFINTMSRVWPLSQTSLAVEAGLREHPLKVTLRDLWRTAIYQTLELLGYGFTKRNMLGKATPEGLFALLCLVWDELIPRSTTKAEDLPTIFASLLDFKAHQILQVPTNLRMLAMLANMPLIPQELLFNRGVRLQPSTNHKNRWVPVTTSSQPIVPGKALVVTHAAPSQSMISTFLSGRAARSVTFTHENKRLEWAKDGQSLQSTRDIIFVLSTLPEEPIKGDIVLSFPDISDDLETPQKARYYYDVQVERGADDEIDWVGISNVAFLISLDWQRGCILLLTECQATEKGGLFDVKGKYDCPVSLKPMSGPILDGMAVFEANMLKVSKLDIEAGKAPTPRLSLDKSLIAFVDAYGFAGKYDRRPYYRSASRSVSILLFFVPLGLAILSAVAGIVLRIYLEVRHKYSIKSTIGIVSLVFFGIEGMQVVMTRLPYMWPPISSILFAIDRQRDPGYFGRLEIACIVTQLLGCYIIAVMFFSTTIQVISRVFKGLYYMYWVRSFAV